MVQCSILKCKNRSVKGGALSFYSFPKEETVANAWLQCCKPKTALKTGRVCSAHFILSDYQKQLRHILMNESPKRCRTLKPDAVPSLHINGVAQPLPCPKPIIERSCSLDDSTEYLEDDPLMPDEKLTNDSETSRSVQTQTQIETRCVGTTTREKRAQTVTIRASEYINLLRIKKKNQVINDRLQQIFTSGQIRSLIRPDRHRVKWSIEDIAAAITLRRRITAEGYKYIKNVIGIPLPGISTLCKWSTRYEVVEEVIESGEQTEAQKDDLEESLQQ